MTYLVVGAGSIGRRHAANLGLLGARVEVAGWRATSAHGVADRLARGDVRGLVIATATQVRLPLIRAAVAADVPVYVEKPLAFRSAEVAEIVAAPVASRSMVGFMMRYHPALRPLAEVDLGSAFRFDLTIGHDVRAWRADWRFSASYAGDPMGGGVLLDLCHEIDIAAFLFPGLTLGAVESLGHARYPGVDVASRVTLRAPGGASGSVAMDYLAPRLVRRCEIASPEAVRTFDFAAEDYRVTHASGVEVLDLPLERNAMFLDAMRDFVALAEGRETSGNPLLPRLDRVAESCDLIARAWEARHFAGTLDTDLP